MGFGEGAVSPPGGGFLVRSHASSGSSVTISLASDQEGSEGTSCGARNRPKQGCVRIPKLIVCIPPEQYF